MSRKSRSRQREVNAKPQPPELRRDEGPESARRWVRWLPPLLVVLVTLATFLPALQNQFVAWDDDQNFLANPHYRGLGWRHLCWMWTTFHMGHYLPLTWMTLGMDYLLWGMNPVGYHLTSLLLHAANAVVFYFLVRRLLTLALLPPPERGRALAVSAGFAALVFAVHPLRVESVAWATERRDVLSGLFYLLTLLVYLRTCERSDGGRRAYWGSVALFTCALLSKSMAVSLPVVLLILDLYPLRRLGGSLGWWSKPARRVYLEKIPFGLLAGAGSAMAFLAISQIHNMAPLGKLGVPGRLALSAYSLGFYLWKTVAPVSLSHLYELHMLNPWATPFLLSYGVVLAVTALALTLRHRVPGLPAAWIAYIVILLPVLGIFQNGPQIAADRYTYLAGLAWAILAGAALLSGWRRHPSVVAALLVAISLSLSALTWSQVQVWHDSEKLWTHALALDPTSPEAQSGVGATLAARGKLAEAIDHYEAALRIKPDFAEAHSNLGAALARQGKPTEAVDHYQQALRLKPDLAEAHNSWGLVLADQGKLVEAIDHYQQALRIKPDFGEAHNNWGVELAQQGKLAEAIDHYQTALRIKPNYADAHTNWGEALTRQGKLVEAIDHYQTALRIKPDDADAHTNWGVALAQQGKLAEAIDHYQTALRIKPDDADVHTNWGEALARQGKLVEAMEHYQRAAKRRPSSAEVRPTR